MVTMAGFLSWFGFFSFFLLTGIGVMKCFILPMSDKSSDGGINFN